MFKKNLILLLSLTEKVIESMSETSYGLNQKGDYLMIHTSHQRFVVYMTMKNF